ncbi:MAG: DUF4149 domain-containing protein [Anaerolineales bacterium]
MNDILQTLAVLLAAAFWGGLVAIDFIVTPIRFNLKNADPESLQRLANEIFRMFGYVQIGLLAGVLLFSLLGGAGLPVLLPAFFALALAGLNAGLLEPMMRQMRSPQLSPEEREAKADTRKQLHQAYLASDLFKVALGALLLVALVSA